VSDKGGLGYVYLLKRNDGWYHIGYTFNPKERFCSWRCQAKKDGYVLRPVLMTRVKRPRLLEKSVHDMFDDRRVGRHGLGPRKEWFLLSNEDVRLVRHICERFGELTFFCGRWPFGAKSPHLHPAILAFLEATQYEIMPMQAKTIEKHVTDIDHWKECVHEWTMRGHRTGNIIGMLYWYRNGIPEPERPWLNDNEC